MPKTKFLKISPRVEAIGVEIKANEQSMSLLAGLSIRPTVEAREMCYCLLDSFLRRTQWARDINQELLTIRQVD